MFSTKSWGSVLIILSKCANLASCDIELFTGFCPGYASWAVIDKGLDFGVSVVVFAVLAPLAGLACKGRWGGLKEARGGCCAASIGYHIHI